MKFFVQISGKTHGPHLPMKIKKLPGFHSECLVREETGTNWVSAKAVSRFSSVVSEITSAHVGSPSKSQFENESRPPIPGRRSLAPFLMCAVALSAVGFWTMLKGKEGRKGALRTILAVVGASSEINAANGAAPGTKEGASPSITTTGTVILLASQLTPVNRGNRADAPAVVRVIPQIYEEKDIDDNTLVQVEVQLKHQAPYMDRMCVAIDLYELPSSRQSRTRLYGELIGLRKGMTANLRVQNRFMAGALTATYTAYGARYLQCPWASNAHDRPNQYGFALFALPTGQ